MIRKIRCSRCGKTYWQGRDHACPSDANRPASDLPERLGDAASTAGCCLAELGCWFLPFGCMLPLTLVAAIAWIVVVR